MKQLDTTRHAVVKLLRPDAGTRLRSAERKPALTFLQDGVKPWEEASPFFLQHLPLKISLADVLTSDLDDVCPQEHCKSRGRQGSQPERIHPLGERFFAGSVKVTDAGEQFIRNSAQLRFGGHLSDQPIGETPVQEFDTNPTLGA